MDIFPIRFLILGIWVLTSCNLSAQEDIFAFAYDKSGKSLTLDSESSDHFTYKYETTKKIMDDLIEAKGSFNMARPKLIMNNAEQKPAWIDLAKAEIVIEEKAYDLCSSLGKDSLSAIALLIAHELIHYYEKHDWHHHFLHNYGSELFKEINTDPLQLELEADQLGGFLANMAGYSTYGVSEKLLDKIYEAYRLKNQSENNPYPNLTERIALANKAESLMQNMNLAFKMSNYLTAIGKYEQASQYLDHILMTSKFQSRELHNNKGILQTLSALHHLGENDMPFYLPIEMDIESRLAPRAVDQNMVKKYLDQAVASFEAALSLDENYTTAQLNLAAVEILRKDYFEAEYLCQKIIRKSNHDSTKSIAHHLMAILYAQQGDVDQSDKEFEKAYKLGPKEVIKHNMSILHQEPIGTANKQNTKHDLTMNNIELNHLYSKIMREEENASIGLEINENECFYFIEKTESNIYVSLTDWGDSGYSFFQIGQSIQFQDRTLGIDLYFDDIKNKFGSPQYVMTTVQGQLAIYHHQNLIVSVNKQNRIEDYILFKSKQ